jgi:hypothetical protein
MRAAEMMMEVTAMAIAGKYFDMVKAAVREAGYTVNGKKGTY